MKGKTYRVWCRMCGKTLTVPMNSDLFQRLPVHTVPRRQTSCPFSGLSILEKSIPIGDAAHEIPGLGYRGR